MQRAIHAALKRDCAARTARIGKSIVAKLAEGNVHEAFLQDIDKTLLGSI
jgi:hypothetical protein